MDLKHLSVVGIINADSGMNVPDYRAEELTFQQLYQVTGRVGRGHIGGNSFIQTRLLDHPVIKSVEKRSWEDFYSYENNKRKLFYYPPYCYLGIFKITRKSSSSAQNLCIKAAVNFKQNKYIKILGPSPSFYEKTKAGYTWQLIVKSNSRKLITDFSQKLPNGFVSDLDPIMLL